MSASETRLTISNAPAYEENPYMEEGALRHIKPVAKIKHYSKRNGVAFEPTTAAEIGAFDGLYNRQDVDPAQFIKLYLEGVGALQSLTPAGLRTFQILFLELQNNIGVPKVSLNSLLAEAKYGMERKTFTRGISDLLTVDFIRKIMVNGVVIPGMYWVNPEYVFNGDRLRFVQDYDKRTLVLDVTGKPKPPKIKVAAPRLDPPLPRQTELEDAIRGIEG